MASRDEVITKARFFTVSLNQANSLWEMKKMVSCGAVDVL
jgi:hypothetical protein